MKHSGKYLRRISWSVIVCSVALIGTYYLFSLDRVLGDYRLQNVQVERLDRDLDKHAIAELSAFRSIDRMGASSDEALQPYSLTYTFQRSDMPVERLSVFVPSLLSSGVIMINMTTVPMQSVGENQLFAPSIGSYWQQADIDPNYFFPGQNQIVLIVGSKADATYLKDIYIAPTILVDRARLSQTFIASWLPTIIISSGAMIVLVSLVGLIFSSSRLTYLATAFLATLCMAMGVGSGVTPLSILISNSQSFSVAAPWLCLILIAAIAVFAKYERESISTLCGVFISLAVVGACLSLLHAHAPFRILDTMHQSGFELLSFLPMLVYVTAIYSANDIAQYRSTLQSLRDTIGVQAVELDEKSKIIAEEMKQRAIHEERQRMMRDIHDGIGGQLLSVLLRVRTGRFDKVEIAGDIQSSLNDLRLVVDAADHFGEDLGAALATFRSRAERQLAAADIRLQWRQSDQLHSGFISSGDTLHLYRFMQEAVTNIIRHSGAALATISITQLNLNDPIEVLLCDDGMGVPEALMSSEGKGLKNLKLRAKKLGAEVLITRGDDGLGTCVRLTLNNAKTAT